MEVPISANARVKKDFMMMALRHANVKLIIIKNAIIIALIVHKHQLTALFATIILNFQELI